MLLSGANAFAADSASFSWPDLSTVPKSAKGIAQPSDAALIVGISDYDYLDKIDGAVNNAYDWREYLRKSKNIALHNIGFLTNKEASDTAVRREAKRIAGRVRPGGTIWFVFIGHGAASSDGEEGLLVGVDARGNADGLDSRSIRQSEIEKILNESQASRVVMIVDACFSGRTSEGKPLAQGLQALVRTSQLKTNSKTILMTAAKSDQFAGPLPGVHRPAFSYLLLGALRGWGDENNDKKVTAEEAINYVYGVFVSLVRGRSQTPELTAADKSSPLAVNVREKGPDIDAMIRQKVWEEVRANTANERQENLSEAEKTLQSDVVTFADDIFGRPQKTVVEPPPQRNPPPQIKQKKPKKENNISRPIQRNTSEAEGEIGPKIFNVSADLSLLWRKYKFCYGVEKCSDKPVNGVETIFDFSNSTPYVAPRIGWELFPAARVRSRYVRGIGIVGNLRKSPTVKTNFRVDGNKWDNVQSDEFDISFAATYRFYYHLGFIRNGWLGLELGYLRYDLNINVSPGKSCHDGFAMGLDAGFPVHRYVVFDLNFTFLPSSAPKDDERAFFADGDEQSSVKAKGMGLKVDVGLSIPFSKYIGANVLFDYARFWSDFSKKSIFTNGTYGTATEQYFGLSFGLNGYF